MATHSSVLAWENPMDRGAWWAVVHGVTKSWTRLKQLSKHTHIHNNSSWKLSVALVSTGWLAWTHSACASALSVLLKWKRSPKTSMFPGSGITLIPISCRILPYTTYASLLPTPPSLASSSFTDPPCLHCSLLFLRIYKCWPILRSIQGLFSPTFRPCILSPSNPDDVSVCNSVLYYPLQV